jgi:gluconokinase
MAEPAPGGTPPFALGIDLGTSAARAYLFDATGANLGGARIPVAWSVGTDGGIQLDPDRLVDAVAEAIDAVLRVLAFRARPIVAVGVSTFWHSLVGVDAAGRPVTPLLPWGDRRAAGAAAAFLAELDGRAVQRRTGAPLHPAYLPARLRWLRRAEPEAWERAATWLTVGDYLTLRLFGQVRTDLSIASATGLLDQRRLDWDAELLGAVGLSAERLPPIAPPDYQFRGLLPDFARRWPRLAEVPWQPPLGDGACASFGSGAAGPDTLALSLGTSGAIRALVPGQPDVPPELWRYLHGPAHSFLGGAVSNGGNVFAWLRRILALPDEDRLEEELRRRPPAGHGLTMLPFIAGERSPGWPLDARGLIAGLSVGTDAVDLVRAGLEAVAFRMALVYRALSRHLPGPRTLIASGGALARSSVWGGILADVLGQPLHRSHEPEASCRGAAILALRAAGHETQGPAPRLERIDFDPARHEHYAAALERHAALEAAATEWWEFNG